MEKKDQTVDKMLIAYDKFMREASSMDTVDFGKEFVRWWNALNLESMTEMPYNSDSFFTLLLGRNLEYTAFLEMMKRKVKYKELAGKDWDAAVIGKATELIKIAQDSGWACDMVDNVRALLLDCKSPMTVLCGIANLYRSIPHDRYDDCVAPFVGWLRPTQNGITLKELIIDELSSRKKAAAKSVEETRPVEVCEYAEIDDALVNRYVEKYREMIAERNEPLKEPAEDAPILAKYSYSLRAKIQKMEFTDADNIHNVYLMAKRDISLGRIPNVNLEQLMSRVSEIVFAS